MKRNIYKKTLGILLALGTAVGLSGCSSTISEGLKTLISPDETYEKETVSEETFLGQDDKSLYPLPEEEQVITMYLTLGMGNESEGTNHTWTEVNQYPLSYYEERAIEPYKCEAVLQVGDEIGPLEGEFGYGELTPNASVRIRGTGSSEQPQKSYRIDIKEGKGKWEDQKAVVLNKHVADPTRLRNKLAYGLIAEIPDMIGARTWFVHLYVKDKTEGRDGLYQDYGLYTAVEQINKTYLKNHGLDSDGQLYKAENFDWTPHPDSIRLATDSGFNAADFERYLEIKGNEDHSKLLELLNVVNDESNGIYDTVKRYFNEDNLYTWMAFHILTGNKAVESGNYYLYSPQASEKWYLISWDNDSCLSETYERLKDESYSASWNQGIFTLVSGKLYERMMKDEKCRNKLDEAVEELRSEYLTPEKVREKTDVYRQLISSYVYSPPDELHQRVTEETFSMLIDDIPQEIEDNYEAYEESLLTPWPFHILEPEKTGESLALRWQDAYLFPGDAAVYSVELAKSPDFKDCLVNEAGYSDTEYRLPMLSQGEYFLRVRAGDGKGRWQDAYEFYRTEQKTFVYSTMCFYVLADGTVAVSRYYDE